MQSLLPAAEKIAACLVERRETIAIAESSTGGLVAAALLAVPGASAYFAGGAVAHTKSSRLALLGTAMPRCGMRRRPNNIRC
jgi:nicotinamide mononucleotide (NMN) deamidase PncC